MKSTPLGVLSVLFSTSLYAQSALTVDYNALWRVDLRTHQGQLLAELDSPDPRFWCDHLASSAGSVLCVRQQELYEVDSGSLSLLATLPGTSAGEGLTFDSLGRLWFVTENDPLLWQLDPDTGAVLGATPLTLVGTRHYALAAFGDRLFVFGRSYPNPMLLEEVDPATGASLSTQDVQSLGVDSPLDAAFGPDGDLWVSNFDGEVILGLNCYSYNRLHLTPLSVAQTWSGCLFVFNTPRFANIAAVQRGPIVSVPTLSPLGMIIAILAMAFAARRTLRRSHP